MLPKTVTPPSFTPHQEEVLLVAGGALMYVQRMEFILSKCTLIAFAPEQQIDFESIQRLDKRQRERTLGQLVRQLREHFPFAADVEERLSRFVSLRNRFVHQLFLDEETDFYRKRSLRKAHAIISDLIRECIYLEPIFAGSYFSWRRFLQEEAGEVDPATKRALKRRDIQKMELSFRNALNWNRDQRAS